MEYVYRVGRLISQAIKVKTEQVCGGEYMEKASLNHTVAKVLFCSVLFGTVL